MSNSTAFEWNFLGKDGRRLPGTENESFLLRVAALYQATMTGGSGGAAFFTKFR